MEALRIIGNRTRERKPRKNRTDINKVITTYYSRRACCSCRNCVGMRWSIIAIKVSIERGEAWLRAAISRYAKLWSEMLVRSEWSVGCFKRRRPAGGAPLTRCNPLTQCVHIAVRWLNPFKSCLKSTSTAPCPCFPGVSQVLAPPILGLGGACHPLLVPFAIDLFSCMHTYTWQPWHSGIVAYM